MKKITKIAVSIIMCVSLCACGASVSTEKSATGQISTKITGTKVTLNHTEFEFPEGYTFTEGKITEPIGISCVQVANPDGKVMGVCSDGMYTEDITEDNLIDAANAAYMAVHKVENPLDITADMFVSGKNVKILVIGLDDGNAIYMAQMGTPNFVYMTETDDDSDLVMQDYFDQAVLTLGGQEDYDMFCKE